MSKNGSLIASEILIVDDEEDIRDLIAGMGGSGAFDGRGRPSAGIFRFLFRILALAEIVFRGLARAFRRIVVSATCVKLLLSGAAMS